MNKNLIIGAGGLLFGFGLGVSQMAKQEVVLSFARLQDLGLLLVMGGALLLTYIAFTLYPKWKKISVSGAPLEKLDTTLDKKLIIGAALFGIGWGLAGICPGSAIASLGVGNGRILIGIAGLFIGAFVHDTTNFIK